MAISSSFDTIEKPGVPQDILHIYEHLLFNRYYTDLKNSDLPDFLDGWIEAETYGNLILFYGAFYYEKARKIWRKVLDEPRHSFTLSDLAKAIKVIELEDNSSITISDKDSLLKQINQKISKPYVPIKLTTKPLRSFKIIKATITLQSKDPILEKFFLRFHVVFSDIVFYVLNQQLDSYRNDDELIYRKDRLLVFSESFICESKLSDEKILSTLNNAIKNIDYMKSYGYIEKFFQAFATEPLWQSFPLGFYERTRILTTNQEVVSLLSLERIEEVLKNISIDIPESLTKKNP